MTIIRDWLGIMSANPRPDLSGPYMVFLTQARAGWTLMRTVADLHFQWHQSSSNIPPFPVAPIIVGLYQFTNVSSEVVIPPQIQDMSADWLWYEQAKQFNDSGTASGTQIDINWSWDLHVDSEARRKVTVDQPSLVVAMDSHKGDAGGVPTAYPAPRWWVTIRQLWQHEI